MSRDGFSVNTFYEQISQVSTSCSRSLSFFSSLRSHCCFHFLNNYHVMNLTPKNYAWPEFYDNLLDMQSYMFSWRAIRRRLVAARKARPRWLPWVNVVRARCSEGVGRIRHYTELCERLENDQQVRRFWEGETTEIPDFLTDWIKKDIGPFWDWLPEGALYHDPNAYLNSTEGLKQVEATA